MKIISIYNNFLQHNKDNREILIRKIKNFGYETGRDGEFIFVIGGDGTFLQAMRKNMRSNPTFIGINTGNLGFLSEFKFDEVDKILKLIKSGDYKIQRLPIYKATISYKEGVKNFYFLNDVTIERKDSRIIHSSVNVNGQRFCDISGDGLVFSSSIGSTGYAVSAGGSISYDCDDVLQLNPISPVHSRAYQSLTKTVMFKDKNEITVFPSVKKNRRFRVVCDGNEIKLNGIKYIKIEKSEHSAELLRSKDFDNTKNLREKVLDDEIS